MRYGQWRVLGIAGAMLLSPTLTFAHAFGQQFNLPLPASFYILGGVCAFMASAAVILLFSEPRSGSDDRQPFISVRISTTTNAALRWLGVGVAVLLLIVSFFGSQNWSESPVTGFFWIWLLLGFTYLTAFVGGVWEHIDPFRTIAQWSTDKGSDPTYAYPKWLGYLPAIVFFFLLISLELFSSGLGAYPIVIGGLCMLYALVSNAGSALFGVDTWFRYADFFTVFFGAVGKVAPIQFSKNSIEVGIAGERLVREQASRISFVLFILSLLAATALDGLKDTGVWNKVVYFYLPHLGISLEPDAIGIIALLIVPCIFFGLYVVAMFLGQVLTRTTLTLQHLLLRFAYSLIPIAIAYHFAHYFYLLIGEGQQLIPQISDPFTRGWDLFGTKNYTVNFTPIGADMVWYIQLGTIIIGHIIAAIVAHRIGTQTFSSKRDIILSQLPVLILMVFYTALGLWILTQR